MKYLIPLLILAVLLFAAYYIFHPEMPEEMPEQVKKKQIQERIKITDSVDKQQSERINSLEKQRDQTVKNHLNEKLIYRIMPADSSIELLAATLENYQATKDSFK